MIPSFLVLIRKSSHCGDRMGLVVVLWVCLFRCGARVYENAWNRMKNPSSVDIQERTAIYTQAGKKVTSRPLSTRLRYVGSIGVNAPLRVLCQALETRVPVLIFWYDDSRIGNPRVLIHKSRNAIITRSQDLSVDFRHCRIVELI